MPAAFDTSAVASDESQTTSLVRSWTVPSENVPVAANCWLVPSAIEGLVGVTSSDTRTAFETVSVVEPLTPESVAVIVVSPRPIDCARPLLPASFEIVDLSHVWVLADAYESDLGQVKVGMSATLTLKAFPNRTFKGRVAFIDPLLDPKTRTAKVRVEFPNPTGELRPEMFGEVVFHGRSREGVRIPADAVIESRPEGEA